MVIFFTKIFEAIEKRRLEREEMKNEENSERSTDFIDLFLDAEDSSVVDEHFVSTGLKVSKKMTTPEIAGQCFVFLLAGFDTTANTLAITSFYLARNPKMQEKLIKEVDEIFGNGAEFSYENLNKMKYADCVMKEALRMWPIAAFAASRECQEPTTLSNGIQLEPGDCVALDLYSLHYDKKIWGEDADEFNPERFMDFTPEMQMAYYPFGGGPRTCIGMRLAYLEEKMILAKIFQKYRFELPKTAEIDTAPKMIGNTIHNPEKVDVLLKYRQ
uniref:Cytochrome P450 n=1 Tax=Panagrolaimus sp. JU765 TaxID=591449 RepID=A0AC34R2V2_9BILA